PVSVEQVEAPAAEPVVVEQLEAPVEKVSVETVSSNKSIEVVQPLEQPLVEVVNVGTSSQTTERVRFNRSAASPMTKASPSKEPENVITPNAMPDELRTIIRSSSLGAGSKAPTACASAKMASPAPVE
ncbi:hypothetical protein JL49_00635, partial [Pseudoalteromonas luteoviolacea]